MGCTERIRTMKLVIRCLGAAVCLMFAIQGVIVFSQPALEDFWVFCHWIGEGMLGLLVGLAGMYLEVRGSMKSVAQRLASFAMNRIVLVVYYFWLGCYAMGGVGGFALEAGGNQHKELKALAHATGVVAWFVALGNLMIACCTEAYPDSEDEESGLTPKSSTSGKASSGTSTMFGAGSGTAANGGSTAMPPQLGGEAADVTPPVSEPPKLEEPSGGWNTLGSSRPFGSS
eukprot:TRINITY_DN12607_c0_g1_i3.p1 TRINITY_DN12607_c0_g1~~TRINITY_DN12607_c0_g1_i3.p1  ORF type:complete len:229 (-),score=36.71 TRINITY_DN12607_c0_g1_i3:422-1108(-)